MDEGDKVVPIFWKAAASEACWVLSSTEVLYKYENFVCAQIRLSTSGNGVSADGSPILLHPGRHGHGAEDARHLGLGKLYPDGPELVGHPRHGGNLLVVVVTAADIAVRTGNPELARPEI